MDLSRWKERGRERIMGIQFYYDRIGVFWGTYIASNTSRAVCENYESRLKKAIEDRNNNNIGLFFCPICAHDKKTNLLSNNTDFPVKVYIFTRVFDYTWHLFSYHPDVFEEWKDILVPTCAMEDNTSKDGFLYTMIERPKRDSESLFSDDEFLERISKGIWC